jgi:hypothetical protein
MLDSGWTGNEMLWTIVERKFDSWEKDTPGRFFTAMLIRTFQSPLETWQASIDARWEGRLAKCRKFECNWITQMGGVEGPSLQRDS